MTGETGIVQGRPGEAVETDVAIIGAGPTGLFAAIELRLLDLMVYSIDILAHAADAAGGRLVAPFRGMHAASAGKSVRQGA
jgi:2-polyprenyl-6-methoxyphenol hydroxylase-like FAD-dependent oxidoreductase